MGMICKDILGLPSLKDLRIVAGTEGMDRPVRWIYIAECFEDTRQIVDWLFGGELVFITGLGIKGNMAILAELIEKINAKNVSGLIVNIGPYIPNIPQEIIDLADRLSLPILEIPWETRLVEITRDLCSAIFVKEMEEKSIDNLLENILFSDSYVDEGFTDRAAHYGYDLTGACRMCIVDIDHFSSFLKQKGLKDEGAILNIKNIFKRIVHEALLKNNKKALTMLRSDSVILLAQVHGNADGDIRKVIDDIRKGVSKKLEGLTVSVGIGNPYSGLGNMRKSLREAEQALRVAKFSSSRNAVYYYNDLGIYTLIYNVRDQQVLEKFYHDILGSVIEYDRINSSSLLSTLEMYLRESGNITITSEKLFIHRNTLKYRVQKIEEILGCDLKDFRDCINLEVALMIGRYLNNSNG